MTSTSVAKSLRSQVETVSPEESDHDNPIFNPTTTSTKEPAVYVKKYARNRENTRIY
jgi:hypothetical protein